MQNIPDNKLDDFFRGKSENARIAFDPKAWEKMEQKLESAYSKRAVLRRLFLSSLLLLLVISSIVSWKYLSASESTLTREVMAKEKEQKLSENQIEDVVEGKEEKKNLNETSFSATERKTKMDISEKADSKTNQTNKIDRADSNQYTEDKLTESEIKNTGKTFKENKSENLNNKRFTDPETMTYFLDEEDAKAKKLTSGKLAGDNNPQREVEKVKINNSEIDPLKVDQNLFKRKQGTGYERDDTYKEFYLNTLSNRGLMLNRSSWPLVAQLTFSPKEDKVIGKEYVSNEQKKDIKPKLQKSVFADRVRLSFQVSPDVSSALGIHFGKTGYNLGISLEYFLLNRVSVTASLLKANKVYTSSPDCYEFPSSYSHRPERIDGSCVVWDVPINLRYFYFSSPKVRTYASAGVSSYIMRKEAYKYEYYTYSSTYKYPKGNNHLFSVINFSVGAEYKLGERFSVGIEPFLKIPMKGVGEGKIKLNTAGAFLSVNYNLFKK